MTDIGIPFIQSLRAAVTPSLDSTEVLLTGEPTKLKQYANAGKLNTLSEDQLVGHILGHEYRFKVLTSDPGNAQSPITDIAGTITGIIRYSNGSSLFFVTSVIPSLSSPRILSGAYELQFAPENKGPEIIGEWYLRVYGQTLNGVARASGKYRGKITFV